MLAAALELVVQEMMVVVHLVSNLVAMVLLHSRDLTISPRVVMLPIEMVTVEQAVEVAAAPKVVLLVLLLAVMLTQAAELVVDLTEILLTSLVFPIRLVVDLLVVDNLLQEAQDMFQLHTLIMMEIQTQYLISQQ